MYSIFFFACWSFSSAHCSNCTGPSSAWQNAMEGYPNIERNTSVSLWQSQKQNIDLSRQAKFASTPAFALFVTLKNVVCKIGEDAEVLMSLYDPVESKFIRWIHVYIHFFFLSVFPFVLSFVKAVEILTQRDWKQIPFSCQITCLEGPFQSETHFYFSEHWQAVVSTLTKTLIYARTWLPYLGFTIGRAHCLEWSSEMFPLHPTPVMYFVFPEDKCLD